MNTSLLILFKKIASNVGRVQIFKQLLSPIYSWFLNNQNRKLNSNFKKYGLETLQDFDKIMIENNIHYAVFAGTLLGAIREKGFLKHDIDIDTVMFYKDYDPKIHQILTENGFQLKHKYEIENGRKGLELTYCKHNVGIDIFFIYSDQNFPTYQCDFHEVSGTSSHEHSMQKYGYVATRRIEFPISYHTRRVPFETIYVNIPQNAEEWLCYRYGKDYMTPDPTFRDKGDNPNIKEWTEVKAIMTYIK